MTSTGIIRILLADDHRLFSDGLRALLLEFDHIQVLQQVYHGPEVANAAHHLRPDVILLDFNMPRMNGMEVARQLLSDMPESRILMLSMYKETRHIEEFKKMGVKGYLLKTTDAREVVRAIETIHQGSTWFEKNGSEGRVNNHSEDFFLKTLRLTPREMDVLRLIKQGDESESISKKLFISLLTVETHRKNICTKLNLSGRNELLRFAIENNIE